jgi:methanogenic corrinoid protein MtbC1
MPMEKRHLEASQALDAQRVALSEAIVGRQYALQPATWKPYGEDGRQKSVRDVGYHLTYLSEALASSNPTLFADYVAWAKVLFAGLQFSEDVLATTLQFTREVLEEELPPALTAITSEYIARGLESLAQAPAALPTFLPQDAPLGELARQYLDALLRGERHTASQLVLNAIDQGASIKDVYLHVFQQSQYEIGRLWQMNKITVAQEHYCTAATQLVMSQLYPRLFATARIGRRLVATCIGDELHELGVRMVADFFEMEGWDTYYLGANTPPGSILRTLEERRAEILAVSATMTSGVRAVAGLIARVRASERGRGVKILVGGYPFNLSNELWRHVGADAYAPDAEQAVAVASDMVGGPK